MTKAQLLKTHADRTEVAKDQDQTLSVMSGSASTNLPLGGSGSGSEIRLEGRGKREVPPKVKGGGHCSGGGKQGSGKFQELVKKHKGDMKAASREYKGSGLYPKFVEDGMDSLNKAGKDIFGSGQPLAVEQFLDEGASVEQDGSGYGVREADDRHPHVDPDRPAAKACSC
jgi:hypothetical protein